MDFEAVVMHYLAAKGLFLSPQFSIRDSAGERSCPDFVALDFLNREIQVVEVTTAYEVKGLIEKLENREEQWFKRLRPQLIRMGVTDDSWKCVVCAYVRKERRDYIERKIQGANDVRVTAVEDIAFSWNWPWNSWAKA